MANEKTYEMLWDCPFCGANKLLGLTHRFCPNCGAPQDPKTRYFPSEQEKVAVEDHVYAGVDRSCPACREANGAIAKHCRHCGSPMDGAASVGVRADQLHGEGSFGGDSAEAARRELLNGATNTGSQVAGPGQSGGSAKGSSRSKFAWLGAFLGLGCLTVILGGGVLMAVMMFWTREAKVEVAELRWERSVEVERYGRVREKAWCDQKPSGAREISRERAQRGTEKVKVGEDCKTRKKDRGDGTFSEVRECEPRYDSKATFDDRCTFDVFRWLHQRSATQEGRSVSDSPRWPATGVVNRGMCEGCERETKRTEKYTVYFREAGAASQPSCELPEAQWRTFRVGNKYRAVMHKLTGTLDCDSLVAGN